jgi:hypothetical protein
VNAFRDVRENKDYVLWYQTCRDVLDGKPLYEQMASGEPEFMYPPAAAVLFYMPLTLFGPFVFVAALGLISAVAWAASVWLAATLVGGGWKGHKLWHIMFPGFAVTPYVWDIQLLGQLNLLLLAMTLGAFYLIRQHKPIISSALFGAAVALKAFPLPAIAYFVVRRQWLAVAGSITSIFLLLWFFPGLIRGFERNTAELKQWTSLMIADQSGNKMAGRSSIGFSRRNQSLVSLSHRLLRHIETGGIPEKPCYVNFIDVPPQVAQVVGYGSCLVLGLILLLACRFRFGTSREAEGIEIAMVCTLVPLCSPLSWTYFFCWLLPGWSAVMFWSAESSLSPTIRRKIGIGSWTSLLLLASAISEQFDPTLQAYGVTALGTVTLFLTLAYIRYYLSLCRHMDPAPFGVNGDAKVVNQDL